MSLKVPTKIEMWVLCALNQIKTIYFRVKVEVFIMTSFPSNFPTASASVWAWLLWLPVVVCIIIVRTLACCGFYGINTHRLHTRCVCRQGRNNRNLSRSTHTYVQAWLWSFVPSGEGNKLDEANYGSECCSTCRTHTDQLLHAARKSHWSRKNIHNRTQTRPSTNRQALKTHTPTHTHTQ